MAFGKLDCFAIRCWSNSNACRIPALHNAILGFKHGTNSINHILRSGVIPEHTARNLHLSTTSFGRKIKEGRREEEEKEEKE